MNALDERILAIIEKNSRVGIKELAVLLGTNEEEVINSMVDGAYLDTGQWGVDDWLEMIMSGMDPLDQGGEDGY